MNKVNFQMEDMMVFLTQNEIYNVMHSKIINKMRISNVLIIGLAILHFAVLSRGHINNEINHI